MKSMAQIRAGTAPIANDPAHLASRQPIAEAMGESS